MLNGQSGPQLVTPQHDAAGAQVFMSEKNINCFSFKFRMVSCVKVSFLTLPSFG